jgi:hypothetical protein
VFGYLKDSGRYLLKTVPGLNLFVDGVDAIYLAKIYDDNIDESKYLSSRLITNTGRCFVDFLQFASIAYNPSLMSGSSNLPEILFGLLPLSIGATAVEAAIQLYFKRGDSKFKRIQELQRKGIEDRKKRREDREKHGCILSSEALHELTDIYETEPSTGRKVKLLEKLDTGIYGFCNGGKDLHVDSYVPAYETLGEVIDDVKKYHLGVETFARNVKQILDQKCINYEKKLLSLSRRYVVVSGGGGFASTMIPADYVVYERTIESLDKVLFVVGELLNNPGNGQQEKDLEKLEDEIKKGEPK